MVPDDEFKELSKVYPLGKYTSSHGVHWFTLKIPTDSGQIKITWFREHLDKDQEE